MPTNRVETIFNWYFRFNGYFTTPNFTVHPDYRKRPGGGEADILAIRFPFSREEPRGYSFSRDDVLKFGGRKLDFVIAECKSSVCDLNDAWRNRDYGNVQYAIKWMGLFRNRKKIDKIAEKVYANAFWKDKRHVVRMIVCGKYENEKLREKMPGLVQIGLEHAIRFLRDRFNAGCNQVCRDGWDDCIREFGDLCEKEKHDIDKLMNWVLHGTTRSMRKDEIAAVESFRQHLLNKGMAVEPWQGGDESPDFYLTIGERFAVEVTNLIDDVEINGNKVPRLLYAVSTEKLASEIEKESRDRGILKGSCQLWVNGPFEDFPEVKKHIKLESLAFLETDEGLFARNREVLAGCGRFGGNLES